ncbi:MAG: DUF6111 family protein [Pseudomonadota bacterium]|jgi:hypothetical protein|nr:MAG: hypothetical protein DIU57_16580 [Pseudomonadota bacterium]
MIRLIIENTLLFLLPTVIYVAYVLLKRRIEGNSNINVFDDAPLIWLVAAGAALVMITLITFGSVSGGKPGQVYYPPVYRDGKIIPGHYK